MPTTTKQKQAWCKSCQRKTLHVATIQTQDMGCGFIAGNLFLCIVTVGLWVPIFLVIYGLGICANAMPKTKYLCQVCGRQN